MQVSQDPEVGKRQNLLQSADPKGNRLPTKSGGNDDMRSEGLNVGNRPTALKYLTLRPHKRNCTNNNEIQNTPLGKK